MNFKFEIKTKFNIGDLVTLKSDQSFISEVEHFYFDYATWRHNSYTQGNFLLMYKLKDAYKGWQEIFLSENLVKVDESDWVKGE